MTHTDPKAERGAWAVALAAPMASAEQGVEPERYLERLRESLAGEPADELVQLVARAVESRQRGETPPEFADSLGLREGVSGYIYHTVPVVLHAWFSHSTDYSSAVQAVVGCGGDTDSTAAIVGGIVGSAVGKDGIPSEWLEGIWEWPRSVGWMERLAASLADAQARQETLVPPNAVNGSDGVGCLSD